MGCRVRSYVTVSSTMDVARRMAEGGCAKGTLVVADTQTLGRGRFNRPWASPPGTNLTLSIVLRPSPELLRDMNMAATVALVRCIRDMTGLKPTVKWPNDVRIDGKKVCGVLIEGHLADLLVGHVERPPRCAASRRARHAWSRWHGSVNAKLSSIRRQPRNLKFWPGCPGLPGFGIPAI